METISYGVEIQLLTGNSILRACDDGYLGIKPFTKSAVQGISYDIAVAGQEKDGKAIDFERCVLRPHTAMNFVSLERFTFPVDMYAVIYLRSTYARLCVSHSCLGLIHCGWRGNLVLEISNHSDIDVVIQSGDRVATIQIFQISEPVRPYDGHYQDWTPS